MQKVYLLDRNAVSLIKSFHTSGNPKDTYRRTFLNKLRKLDRSWNFISPILAINEGQRGRPEDSEEFVETARQESAAVAKFFRYARTDASFFRESDSLRELPNGFRETHFNRYVQFLDRVAPDVKQPKASDKRRAMRTEILAIAEEMRVARGHLIVICVLSALYGNRAAIGILNPRVDGNKSYNAASDLMVMSRICQFEAIDTNKSIDFQFKTMDKHLSNFLKLIRTTHSELSTSNLTMETVQYSIRYNIDARLFPDMREVDFLELKECFLNEPTA